MTFLSFYGKNHLIHLVIDGLAIDVLEFKARGQKFSYIWNSPKHWNNRSKKQLELFKVLYSNDGYK